MEGHEKYLHQILLRPQARSLINLRDSQQNTACHIAAQRGHARVCAVLIANGADVRVKNHKDKTPMHFAVEEGHDRIVRLLHQADHKLVQDADENLDLPIHKAAINAKLKCARLLIELESEINTPNGKGMHYNDLNGCQIISTTRCDPIGTSSACRRSRCLQGTHHEQC